MKNKKIAIAGHAGIGHVHGVSGFVQDDTAGFIAVAFILKEWLNADTRVLKTDVDIENNTIKISTIGGGEFLSSPRRGITPSEAMLMNKIIGQDAIFCQILTIRAFAGYMVKAFSKHLLYFRECLQILSLILFIKRNRRSLRY